MFWRVAGYSQTSPIETILDKDAFTLEELLDEDDLIQECKSLNDRLVAFLRSPDTILKLIDYITVAPDEATFGDNKKRLKYPFAACEVFCCEVDGIINAMLDGDEPLDRLYSLLDSEPPLNCVMAGYFTRVLTSLIVKRSQDVLQHLQQHQQLLRKLVRHISSASIAEMLVRIVGADDNLAMYMSPLHLSWLTETPLMGLLLEQLSPAHTPPGKGESTPEADIDAQKHAAGILAAIAHNHDCPLAIVFTDPDFLQQLFARAFAPSNAMQALDVCLALLEQRQIRPDNASTGPDSPSGHDELDMHIKDATVQGILAHLARLMEILDGPGPLANPGPHLTPYGKLQPPLGITRLKAVELVAALLRTDNPAADAGVTECGALGQCLKLFSSYPFHNLLHSQVTAMVLRILEASSEDDDSSPVLTHLLGPGDLLHWLFSAPTHVADAGNTAVNLSGKANSKSQPATGWMGHVTRMGNKLAEAAGRRAEVAAALGASKEWPRWADNVLKKNNDRENVMQWSCGRPSAAEIANSLDHETDSSLIQDLGEDPPEGAPLSHAAAKAASISSNSNASHRYGGFDPADDDDDDDIGGFQGQSDITLDAAAAFRNLNLNRAAAVSADSSSSDDDSDGSPPAAALNPMMDDDTVMVSSHDVDGDDSALSQSLNFADFDAFPASPPTAHEASKLQENSSEAVSQPPAFSSWSFPAAAGNGANEDAGWAVFDEPTAASPYGGEQAATQSVPVNIPFPGRGQKPGVADSAVASAGGGTSPGGTGPDVQPSAMAAPEYNAFTYWRPPPDELVEMEPDEDEEQDSRQQLIQQQQKQQAKQQQQQQQQQKQQQQKQKQEKQAQVFSDRRQAQLADVHETRQRGRASLELRPHSGGSSDFRPIEAAGGSAWVATASGGPAQEASGRPAAADSAPEADSASK